MKTRLFLGIVALAAIFGCNRDTGSATGSPTPGTAKVKIVYIPKQSGNPYFDEVVRGFKEASDQLGCDFTSIAPSTGEATSQLPILKEQIQRGVDVIAISPNSDDALNATLDQARAKGITIITVDADLTGNESHRDACVLQADFNQIGPSQVELLGKLTNYQGSFAILSATTNAPNQNAWIAKMKDALKDPKYAKMKLVDTVYGDDEPAKSTTECEGLLAKYPDLSGIISPTSVGLAASAQVLERSGRYPGGPKATGAGIQLTGLSTPNQLKKYVDEGAVTSFQLWAPYNEGFIAAYVGQQMKLGKLKPAPGLEIDVPKLGSRKFSDKLELIGGELITFDKSNIAKYNF